MGKKKYNQKVETYVLFSRHTEDVSPRYSLSHISKELSQRDKGGEKIYRWLLWWLIVKVVKVLATQSCPALCDPMDCSLPAPLSMEFPRQEYWSTGVPFPSPGDLSQPRVRACVSHISCIGRWVLYHCTTW